MFAAIDLDRDRIEQGHIGAPGAQAGQIALQRFHRAFHAAFDIGLVIYCGMVHSLPSERR
jgi:hypothetical protein